MNFFTNFICNIDLSEVFDFHSEKDADITIVYKKGNLPSLEDMMSITVDGNSRVTSVAVNPQNTQNVNFNTGIVLARKALLEYVWDYEYYGDVRTVDVTVRRVREKIEDDPSQPRHIMTKRGVGYYFAI